MSPQKLVSILIPVYNRVTLIEETIRSALNQTYTNIEVVVVDNQSTDGTWDVLGAMAAKDKRIRIFQNERNIGPIRNWEVCIERAEGEYGKILWSDDLIAPDYLEKTVGYLEDPLVGFVYSSVRIFKENPTNGIVSYRLYYTGKYSSNFFVRRTIAYGGVPLSPGCAIFRTRDLKKNLVITVPGSDAGDSAWHGVGPDLLLFLITATEFPQFAYVDEPLAFFRAHSGSISIGSSQAKLSHRYDIARRYYVNTHNRSFRRTLDAAFLVQRIVVNIKEIATTKSMNQTECGLIRTLRESRRSAVALEVVRQLMGKIYLKTLGAVRNAFL